MMKHLKDVTDEEISSGLAYLDTFRSEVKIESLNRKTWWVHSGGCGWRCHPNMKVSIREKEILICD